MAGAALDGFFYVVGEDSAGTPVLQAYDPASDSWTVKTPPPMRLSSLTAAAGNGVLYVNGDAGDPVSSYVYAYDPGLDSWSHVAAGADNRLIRRVIAALDGRVYAIGGFWNILSNSRHCSELVDGFFDGSEAALLEFLRPIAVAAPSTPPPPHEEHQIDTVLL